MILLKNADLLNNEIRLTHSNFIALLYIICIGFTIICMFLKNTILCMNYYEGTIIVENRIRTLREFSIFQ